MNAVADPLSFLIVAVAATLALAVASAALLRGWSGWLELRRLQLGARRRGAARPALGDLRERVRRLEAIASGVAD